MNFRLRAFAGLLQIALTLAMLLGAVMLIQNARSGDDNDRRGGNQNQRERSFAVDVVTLTPTEIRPVLTAFGEVISTRTLELRAAAGGALVELSDNFVEGGSVRAGELLFKTDPASARAALNLAKANLAEAQAEYQEAIAAVDLAKDELRAAERQETLRDQALTRQKTLIQRGVGTESALEAAQLASASAQSATLAKRQALANANARITRAESALDKSKINQDEALRKLTELSVVAEFDGVLSDINAVKGGLVGTNERLGKLIDPNALEVSIRLSNAQFANLQRSDGGLDAARVNVIFQNGTPIEAKIVRIGGAVNTGTTGRQVFAKLPPMAARFLQPGDFVTVTIEEAALRNVVLIPASAATNVGEVLLIDADDRLVEAELLILRKQGDSLIVDPTGHENDRIVKTRAPQLGAGIKVSPRAQGDAVLQEQEMVTLTPDMQAEMTAAIENSQMPDFVKERILKRIASGKMPKENYDRLQARMGGANNDGPSANADRPAQGQDGNATGNAQAGDLVTLSADQQAKLTELVNANANMPDAVKTRLIDQIKTGQAPKRLFNRFRDQLPKGEG